MDILITLNSGLGADVGPNFNLTVNDGGTITPNTATRTELLAGKLVTVSAGSTNIFVTSTGVCTTQLIIPISGITSTTTTTTTLAPTTTTTSTSTTTTSTSTTSTSTTLAPVSVTLAYSDVNGPTACYKFTDPSPITSTYYLRPGEVLADGYTIYTDSIFTTIAPDGFYSNGVDYWEVNVAASGGVLSNGTPCPQTTTTTTSTSTTSTTTSTTSTSTSTSTSTTSTTTAAPTTTTTTSGGGGTTTTTATPTFRTIQINSAPGSSTTAGACAVTTGLTKYIAYSFAITNGLEIFNDSALTTRTYTNDPYAGNYASLLDVNSGLRYAVTFDSSGLVSSFFTCTAGTTTTTTTTQPPTTTTTTTTQPPTTTTTTTTQPPTTTTTTTTSAPASAPTVDTCSGQTNLAIFNSATGVSLGYTDPVGPGGNLLFVCTIGGSPLATGNSDSFIGVFAPSYSTQLSGANGKQLRTWKNGTLFSTINITSSPITVSGDAAFGSGDLVILEVVN